MHVIKLLRQGVAFFLGVLFTLMVVTVAWQVFSRFFTESPSSFTEELARFQLIWLGFAGATYAFLRRMHVGIDLFVGTVPERFRIFVEQLVWAACGLFGAILLFWGGLSLVLLTHRLGQTSASLGVPMSAVYAIIPVCGFIIAAVSVYYSVFPNTAPRANEVGE